MRPEFESQTVQKIENPTAVDKDGCRCRCRCSCSCCCCKVGGRVALYNSGGVGFGTQRPRGGQEAAATARRENHQSKGPPFHWFLRTSTHRNLESRRPTSSLTRTELSPSLAVGHLQYHLPTSLNHVPEFRPHGSGTFIFYRQKARGFVSFSFCML